MAVKITGKPNTDAPTSDYPNGNIRDDDGTGNGTPVNTLVYADMHQFFGRLLSDAEILNPFFSVNNIPDNDTNGWQISQAFGINARDENRAIISWIAQTLFSEFYPSNPIAMLGLEDSGTAVAAGYIYYAGKLYVCGGLAYGTVVNTLRCKISAENTITIVDSAVPLDFDYSALVFYQNTQTKTKRVPIGAWNMKVTGGGGVATLGVNHGLTDFTKIRGIKAIINPDTTGIAISFGGYGGGVNTLPINAWDFNTGKMMGSVGGFDATKVQLQIYVSGIFDGASFSSTGVNRGWIEIEYIL